MAIGPVELNGMISRTQDFTTIKQNEDNKGLVDQTNFQARFKQEVDAHANKVNEGDNANQEQKKYDAKEKGNGQYAGNGGRDRKKKEEELKTGKVIVKGRSSFDIKI